MNIFSFEIPVRHSLLTYSSLWFSLLRNGTRFFVDIRERRVSEPLVEVTSNGIRLTLLEYVKLLAWLSGKSSSSSRVFINHGRVLQIKPTFMHVRHICQTDIHGLKAQILLYPGEERWLPSFETLLSTDSRDKLARDAREEVCTFAARLL